jgi:FkbH-like protein
MFEFDKHDRRQGTAARPGAPYVHFEGGRRRALLLWAEHCTECAAPDCYASCSLYQARPDGRCRRFEYGVYRNTNFASASGYGAEVVFKRWGKIEARGNARLFPARTAALAERAIAAAAPLADIAGKLGARLSKDGRWSWLGFSLLDRLSRRLQRSGSSRPDAFIAEIYNPGQEPVTLLLNISADRAATGHPPDRLPRPFLKRLTVQPGYFREDIPACEFAPVLESGLPFNIALGPDADDGAHLVFLTLDLLEYGSSAAAKAKQPAAKCVIFDLDNTLWDGILLEGEISLRPRIAEIFLALDQRGILISAVSKNAPEDALAQLRRFGLEEYLLHPQIGWGPKSEGVRRLAERLDIGTDTLLFIDDNPFERAEVAEAVPGVETLPDAALPTLLDHPRLQGAVTEESQRRRSMYREAGARAEAAASYGSNYRDFLRACETRCEIRPPRFTDRERIAELVQRTNQLNFSGRKYRPEEVDALLADPLREKYVVRSSDRFGDYGMVGFCLASAEGGLLKIHDLMLSCRVQGKFIEQALLWHLLSTPGRDLHTIEIAFVPTPRNGAARAVLASLGFAADGEGKMRLEAKAPGLASDLVTVEGSWPETLSSAA